MNLFSDFFKNFLLLPHVSWGIPSLIFLIAIITLFWLMLPFWRIIRKKETVNDSDVSNENLESFPKVSVIVQVKEIGEELDIFIENILRQDYPDFEVILVCETTHDSTEMISEHINQTFNYDGRHNLYVTFFPPEALNVSKRKLANTIGIKAAKGEIIVTTTSNARIPSEQWLSSLVAPFGKPDQVEMVLGYSPLYFPAMRGAARWFREFDSLLTSVSWIGAAIAGEPFRGDGHNLAFRRELFFRHKGYSKSIHLHCGDDDIFVNEVANGSNTRMVLLPDSILKMDWEQASARIWAAQKEQYFFTERWLPQREFRRAAFLSASQWAILILAALSVASLFFSINALIPAAISILLLLLFWQGEICIYRGVAKRLQATRLWWSLPLFWLLRAPYNLIFRLTHQRAAKRNFTWQRR